MDQEPSPRLEGEMHLRKGSRCSHWSGWGPSLLEAAALGVCAEGWNRPGKTALQRLLRREEAGPVALFQGLVLCAWSLSFPVCSLAVAAPLLSGGAGDTRGSREPPSVCVAEPPRGRIPGRAPRLWQGRLSQVCAPCHVWQGRGWWMELLHSHRARCCGCPRALIVISVPQNKCLQLGSSSRIYMRCSCSSQFYLIYFFDCKLTFWH